VSTYSGTFYDNIAGGSQRSAERLLPLVFERVKPKRVLDVGCGTGGWLAVAQALGAEDVRGIDGPWVDTKQLKFAPTNFTTVEFEGASLSIDGQYDLAMSLEVLEHLSDAAGKRVVAAMCQAAPVVLCGAAIPGQGGNAHINERWQSYWAAEFYRHGFEPWDLVRPALWQDDAVEYWYRQNAILYVHSRSGLNVPQAHGAMPLDVVHPANFTGRVGELIKFRGRYDKTLKRKVGNAIRKLRGKTSSGT
jgi:SAM-dependent methyltransferase